MKLIRTSGVPQRGHGRPPRPYALRECAKYPAFDSFIRLPPKMSGHDHTVQNFCTVCAPFVAVGSDL